MAPSVVPNPQPIPYGWPRAAYDVYEPMRVIGTGGFASVWMAKERTTGTGGGTATMEGHLRNEGAEAEETMEDDENDRRRKQQRKGQQRSEYVAIKIMKNDVHAEREISILSELSDMSHPHPNIVRLLRSSFDEKDEFMNAKDSEKASSRAMVLSLAYGPTLHHVLNECGHLGLVISNVISGQLIRAIAFLHGHAVIHRDIQPCNIIVSGGMMDDDLWYSDEYDVDGKVMIMARKCRITLIDFGFARALCPRDVADDVAKRPGGKIDATATSSTASTTAARGGNENVWDDDGVGGGDEIIGPCFMDRPLEDNMNTRGRRGGGTGNDYDDSVSRRKVLDLSAVGTRSYAAPEILSGIRSLTDNLNSSLRRSANRGGQSSAKNACVSSYGMVADAFSVGATIRHMVTGVPPNMDVEDFIARRNHPLMKLSRSLGRRCALLLPSNGRKRRRRTKRYRSSADLPHDVRNLIHGLTHYDPRRRATVRSATRHPWLETSAGADDASPELEHGGPISYLKCAA